MWPLIIVLSTGLGGSDLGYVQYLNIQHPGTYEPAPVSVQAPSWFGGRIFTSDTLHVGVRPAAVVEKADGLEVGVGVTLQVTTDVL